MNVGRQRDVADAIESREEIFHRFELKQPVAELAALEDFGFQFDGAGRRWKDENFADGDFSSRADESVPAIVASRLGEHDFDAAGGFFPFAAQRAMGEEARGNDAAVVEH